MVSSAVGQGGGRGHGSVRPPHLARGPAGEARTRALREAGDGAERVGRQGATPGEAQTAAPRARGPRRGAPPKPQGAGGVRGLPARLSSRVRGVGDGGQARGDAGPADPQEGGVGGGGKKAYLKVRVEKVTARFTPAAPALPPRHRRPSSPR